MKGDRRRDFKVAAVEKATTTPDTSGGRATFTDYIESRATPRFGATAGHAISRTRAAIIDESLLTPGAHPLEAAASASFRSLSYDGTSGTRFV